jgi:hypothetical protein
MQQFILLLISFLLGCGFAVFLIGFYSIRIWKSRLRSWSLSFVRSGSSGSSHEKPKSKHKKGRKDRYKDHRRETEDRPGRKKSASLSSSSMKKMLTRSILGPSSTPVDIVSPSGQTISVSVEGIPPCLIPNVVSPLARGAADPSVSAPDFGQTPLTNPESAVPAGKNLVVFRGLSEFEILKLLEHAVQEQVPARHLFFLPIPARWKSLVAAPLSRCVVTKIGNTIRMDTLPPPGFQPRLI